MSKEEKVDIEYLSRLANIPLTGDEKKRLGEQVSSILDHVKTIQSLDTEGVKETPQVTGKTNELREDVVEESLSQEQALGQAKRTHKGYFVVDAIFKNEG